MHEPPDPRAWPARLRGSFLYQLAMRHLRNGRVAQGWRLLTRVSDPRAEEFRTSAQLVQLVATGDVASATKALAALDASPIPC